MPKKSDEEILDESTFIDTTEFTGENTEEEQSEEKKFSEEYSPKQIGSITKYVTPINSSVPITKVAETFKKDPILQVLPIEEGGRVVGVIDRRTAFIGSDAAEKNSESYPVANYVLMGSVSFNANGYIEKNLSLLSDLNKQCDFKFFPVFDKGKYLGLVSFDEFLERTAQIREQDLQKASAIQQSFFPTNEELIRNHHDFSIRLWNRMANSLGGDCYKTFPLSDHSGMICCFDVSGKNVAASLLTVAAMCYFKMLKTNPARSNDPIKILAGLDGYLENVVPVGNFITGAIIYVDLKRRIFYVFNCGHTTIFLVYKNPNSDGPIKLSPIAPKLPPFGMGQVKVELEASEEIKDLNKKPYYVFAARRDLHIGLYSDGFTDMMNEDGERYEEERAKKFFVNLYSKPAQDVPAVIEKTVDNYIGKAILPDDITVIDIRFDTDYFS